MMGANALIIIPAIIGTAVALVVVLPIFCAFILAGRISREEERKPLYEHVCASCKRQQWFIEPFDPSSVCRACELVSGPPREIDLDNFADAAAIRVYLDGADVPHLNGQSRAAGPVTHPEAG